MKSCILTVIKNKHEYLDEWSKQLEDKLWEIVK